MSPDGLVLLVLFLLDCLVDLVDFPHKEERGRHCGCLECETCDLEAEMKGQILMIVVIG